MKTITAIASLLTFVLSAFALTSCASMNASSTEPLLSAAGFRVKAPETDAQRQIYSELPAYKVQRGSHKGKVFYAYKDEKQGVAYVGGEEEYQKFQQLATERSIARTQYEAAQMNREMSYRFYGAYPRYGYW